MKRKYIDYILILFTIKLFIPLSNLIYLFEIFKISNKFVNLCIFFIDFLLDIFILMFFISNHEQILSYLKSKWKI